MKKLRSFEDAVAEMLAIKLYEHDHGGVWPPKPGNSVTSWLRLHEEDQNLYRAMASGKSLIPSAKQESEE